MPTTDAVEIIKQWYNVSISGKNFPTNIFSRFFALWIAFNAMYYAYTENIYDGPDGDRNQVEKLSEDGALRSAHIGLLDRDIAYKEAIYYLQGRNGVKDLKKEKRWKIQDIQNITQILNVIYTVRCNLFHGRKTLSTERDEALVERSYIVLSKLIGVLLEDGFVSQKISY